MAFWRYKFFAVSKLSEDVLVVRVAVVLRWESRDFLSVFRCWDEGTVGPADSLPDQGYLLLEREKQPESANTEEHTHIHSHKDTCIELFHHWYTHTLSHRFPPDTHTHTLPKRLNRLIAGTPLRKQPNYHHILHQGQHTHIHHFTCANHILPSYKAIRL